MRLKWYLMSLTFAAALSLSACIKQSSKKEPVTVSIWHVYGGQVSSPLNDIIDEFNSTVGREKGIYVQVTSVSNTNSIHEAVLAASNNELGASELPNMFVSYPKTVVALKDSNILVDYRDYFSEEKLSEFVPEFIEEGMIDGKLNILPLAKSTEIMFINKTAFDRFAKASGAKLSDLDTWEGLFQTSIRYTDWMDSLTPDIEGDGKPMFVHDYHFNYFQVGIDSLGRSFFDESENIDFSPEFYKVWEPYAKAAVYGGVWLKEGYATEPLRTGDAIVSVASSASVLYYYDVVTYPDNTSEQVQLIARPCPIFKDGKKEVMQRGAGICTVKTDAKHEKAVMIFLEWLTDVKNNVNFVTKAGYMPVKKEAFEKELPAAIDGIKEPKYKSLYEAFLRTNDEYQYYTAPQIKNYLNLETDFEKNSRAELDIAHSKYIGQAGGIYDEKLLNKLVKEYYYELRQKFN